MMTSFIFNICESNRKVMLRNLNNGQPKYLENHNVNYHVHRKWDLRGLTYIRLETVHGV